MKNTFYPGRETKLFPTLVITCYECAVPPSIYGPHYYHLSNLGNIAAEHDQLHEDGIRHHVLSKGCKRVLVIGHTSCRAVDQIQTNQTPSKYIIPLRETLTRIIDDCPQPLINTANQKRVITEKLILMQCERIAGYSFMQERNGLYHTTTLSGIMVDGNHSVLLYQNGIRVNDCLSVN